MNFDRSSSSIVLDTAWGEVDKKVQGFIYAKDFPVLIRSIEEILRKGKGESRPLSLLSNTGIDVIDTFAKEKEFFKIYKDEFKEIFQGLIGKSFKDAVEGSMIPKGKLIECVQQCGNTLESPKKSQSGTPRRNNYRIKMLENRLKTSDEELRFKDNIITEKDRELIKLTRNLGEYKDKYEFLQRQFSFYKARGESVNDEEQLDKECDIMFDSSHLKTSTKHEFIISELKRKLQEQTVLITALRDQLQIGGIGFGSGNKDDYRRPYITNLLKSMGLSGNNLFWLFLLMTVSIFSLFYITLRNWISMEDQLSQSHIELSWWESNPVLSRIGWFFKDWTEPMIEYNYQNRNDEAFAAYDRIFGLNNA